MYISFEEFLKMNLRVGEIKHSEPHPNADKLYVLKVDLGDKEIQLFLAATGLKNVNGNGQPSHPSRSPRRQLDYILHSPEIRPADFYLPQVKLSDHIPLVFDFDIRH